MCVFMASGVSIFPSVSVYNGFGLRNKLRDGPLHNEKARGCFSAHMAESTKSLGGHNSRPESFKHHNKLLSVGSCFCTCSNPQAVLSSDQL